MVYVGKNAGAAALIYCIFTKDIQEVAFLKYEGDLRCDVPTSCTEEMVLLALDNVPLTELCDMYNLTLSAVSRRIKRYLGVGIREYKNLNKE